MDSTQINNSNTLEALDCINRQAAIDALDEQIEQCNKALGSFDISLKDEFAIKVERASLKAYREQLENLPPVQPRTGKWILGKNNRMPYIRGGKMKSVEIDIQEKCLDCVCYHSVWNMNLPCNGAFPVHCEYNGTEEEEEGETE